ncbi:aminopeptidase [Marinobacter sp. SS5-14b]|uniref:aminopeptidase n=1 Tax=Marinobacter sp. SS5-14b TaxID=3050456 RepID=UPI0026E005BD|nr:aminopeptidase [Marinobacter sp. SS5-14b]
MKQLSQIYLVLLLFTGLQGCSTFGYYSQAIGGHASLMMRSQPVEEVIRQPGTPPELQHKLTTALAAAAFARNTLQLPVGGAFSDFVALEHPWVVVNLVAVPEFSLQPHQWCYPVIGCQAYRGYFDLKPAQTEQARFQAAGFDTFIGGVTAYSTLGWFDDPLHSGFTALPEARMVALIFHELAHRVVYLNGDTAFNESFATAVELEGLRLWLEQQQSPEQFDLALKRLEHRNRTFELVQATSEKLRGLYQRHDQIGPGPLRQRKRDLLTELAGQYERLSQNYPEPGPFGTPPVQLNNANLALFQQYNQYVPGFRQLLRESGDDFSRFYNAVTDLAAEPAGERQQTLESLSQRFNEHL